MFWPFIYGVLFVSNIALVVLVVKQSRFIRYLMTRRTGLTMTDDEPWCFMCEHSIHEGEPTHSLTHIAADGVGTVRTRYTSDDELDPFESEFYERCSDPDCMVSFWYPNQPHYHFTGSPDHPRTMEPTNVP